MDDLLQVGVISSLHGVKGEVKVFPTTSDTGRYKYLKEVVINPESENLTLKLQGVRFFKQFVIVKFEGFDNPDDILKYKGKPIYVTREHAIRLDKDEYFIADLYGVNVYENGVKIGVIDDVIQTGANDVYAVKKNDGKELLLPAIKTCILNVDIQNNRMDVAVPDGL